MAEFNPFLPQPNIPDWTNAPGRLIDGSGLGEIFGKVTQNIATGYKEIKDTKATNDIYNSADSMIENARTETMAEAAGIPPDVAKAMKQADLMKKAFESGKYSDSAFYNKIGVWSKEMRVRYPQYKEVIDQQLTRVMGRTPANLEMDSVRSQYKTEQTAQSQSAKENMKFLEENGQYIDNDYIVNWEKLTPQQQSAVKKAAFIRKADDSREKSTREQLKIKQENDVDLAAIGLTQGLENLQRDFWSGATKDAGGSYSNLKQMIRTLGADGYSPQDLQAIQTEVEKRQITLAENWNRLVTERDDSGRSYQDYFATDTEGFNRIKGRYDEMQKALEDLKQGKTGYVEWNSTMFSAGEDQRMRKFIEQFGEEAYGTVSNMGKLFGNDVAYTMFDDAKEGTQSATDPAAEAMKKIFVGKAVASGNIGNSVEELTKGLDKSLLQPFNAGARQGVEQLFKTAGDANAPIELRQKAAAAVYTDLEGKFLRTLKDVPDNTGKSSREKAFLFMTSPQQEAVMKELGMEKEYTQWIKANSPAQYATVVEEVNATNVNTKYVDIALNGDTMQLEAKLNTKLVKDPAKLAKWVQQARTGKPLSMSDVPGDIPVDELMQIKVGLDAVQKLNMINGALARALKSENPGMSNEDIAKVLQQNMANMQATYTKKEPWQYRAIEAFSQWAKDTVTGKTASDNAKRVADGLDNLQQGEDFGVVPEGDNDFNVLEDSMSSLGDDDAAAILGFVSKAEGADFNTLFGGSKVILEEKTVAEVQQMQRAHGKKTGSSATGAYQVMRKTLSDLIDQGVVDPDEPFTEDVQNRIGMALLERRGYADWKSGKLTTEQFADRLAQEWAALPLGSGKSAHEGKMGNKARVPRAELVAMLEGLKA